MQALVHVNSMPNQQRGATLLVALIMLVLISLIGVTTLKSASVAERRSANEYQKNLTFQVSESAVNQTLQDRTMLRNAIRTNARVEATNLDINIENTRADVVYTPVGFGAVEGASIGENGVSGQRLMITSTGQMCDSDAAAGTCTVNGNSSTRTLHGIVQLVPGIQ